MSVKLFPCGSSKSWCEPLFLDAGTLVSFLMVAYGNSSALLGIALTRYARSKRMGSILKKAESYQFEDAMYGQSKSTKMTIVKKVYQRPQLKVLGSVRQLTLKLGSISDGMQPHQA